MSEEAKFLVSHEENASIVKLVGEQITDQLYIAELSDELLQLADEANPTDLILDFSDVQFLSSSALGMLTVLLKRVRYKKGRLRLCGIQPQILEAFRITNLDKVFEIFADQDEALSA